MSWDIYANTWLLWDHYIFCRCENDRHFIGSMFFYIHKQPRRKRSRLERSPSKRKAGCSNSSRDRPKSLKPVLTVPLANRWAISVSVMERRRWLLHADSRCGKLKNPHCSMAISGEHKSKFAAFTSNGEVSI